MGKHGASGEQQRSAQGCGGAVQTPAMMGRGNLNPTTTHRPHNANHFMDLMRHNPFIGLYLTS